ncbi:hypothetical protein ES332_D10G207500v1 [Gossypium tomentosum]|uniref:Uncharacterized protein n=1 Tax=Gossypium tomentosum TaxID=34277 RepID=A0A5D2J6U9_GOSTO|nr:hypothetical protein ES332_D10G207500v1 [Gossypium tomentosum]
MRMVEKVMMTTTTMMMVIMTLLFSTKFSTHSHFPQIKNPRNSFPPNFLPPRCHSHPILTTTSSLTLVLSLSRPKLITSSPSFRRQKICKADLLIYTPCSLSFSATQLKLWQ